jgi:branched-chain amino acid transport system permease protein
MYGRFGLLAHRTLRTDVLMNNFLMVLLNGLTYAGLLFLIASGFTLIFGVMRVVNLSHGIFYILGAYVAYDVQKQTAYWLLGVIAGTMAVGITALLVQWLVRRIEGDMPQTILTLCISMMIGDLCLYLWGGLPRTLTTPTSIRRPVTLFFLTYPGFRLFVLFLAIVIAVGLWILLHRTQLGRILRAGADNRPMVAALGINIDRIFAIVFVMAGLMAGLSGAIGGSYIAFGPGSDFSILTYALVVVITGGMGSVAGSALGALIVGLVDSFGRSTISGMAIFLLMGTLIVVLAFRPQGLLGRGE